MAAVQARVKAREITAYLRENISDAEGGEALRQEVLEAMRASDLAPIGICL